MPNFVGCLPEEATSYGDTHHRTVGRILSALRLARFWFRSSTGEINMNAMYVLSGTVSAGLLIYLMIALLKAEWF